MECKYILYNGHINVSKIISKLNNINKEIKYTIK